MIGRQEPLRRITQLLDAAREQRAGSLVVVGEAGIGKTALLDEVAASAEGFQLLRAQGFESETALGHAALLQLLGPVRRHLDGVPAPQRRALEAALGWGPSAAAEDRFLVAAGVVSLLARAAEEAPVLVVVDDVHWLDAGSAAAILFAARRLAHDAVAILLATRNGSPPGTALDGLEVIELSGLSSADAAGLFPAGTASEVIAQLVAGTQGNPLALVETAGRLTPTQRRGAAPIPHPVGGHLESVFEPVVTDLTAEARFAVQLVAAGRDDAVEPVLVALRARDLEPEVVLGEAETRDILVQEPGAVRFRHPMLRSTAWAMATPTERRAAHLALGAAMPDDRRRDRVWHLAEAATAPDAELAAELEAFAVDDRHRSGHAAASAALERASRLSEDAAASGQRLAVAVEDAALAGDVGRARELAERLLVPGVDAAVRGRTLATLGFLEEYTGSVPRAAHLLGDAAALVEGQLRVRVLAELAIVFHRLGDYSGIAGVADSLAVVADRDDPHQQLLSDYCRGVASLTHGDQDIGRAFLLRSFELYRSEPSLRDDPRHLVPATLAAGWLGLDPAVAAFLEGRLAHARDRGALTVLVPTLAMFSYGRAMLFGDHAAAFADAGEAVELGTELGFIADVAPALEMLAWQYAARGLHEQARAELERSARLVDQAGTASVAAHLALARAFCALCRDDFDEVVALLEPRLEADDGRGAMGEALGVAPPLVEAYVAIGRKSDASLLSGRYAAVPEPDGPTRAMIARCHGLAVDDHAEAVTAFEAAVQEHVAAADAPFELARTELMLGSRLRRDGRRTAARAHLRSAMDRFTAMDLTLWVQRSAAELAATGETVRTRRYTGDEPLTSQESRVAILVSQGLSNREVAAALFVSPKTVEYHLSNVYRKRGLRSRSELARAMATNATQSMT